MEKRNRTIRIITFLMVIVLVLTACRITKSTGQITQEPQVLVPQQEATPIQGQSTETVLVPEFTSLDGSLEALYETLSPGVVSIQYTTDTGGGQGTGFVYDKEGHIITNYHVASDATELEVHFPSGLKVFGTVIGSDLDSDLAVVKVDVDPSELVPLPLGDSNAIKVGQTVVAIGNPYGLSGTMTMGIISARGRVLDSMRQTESGTFYSAGDTIQTDALINPGNSGGPLINLNGEVIGVNRAIQTAGTSVTGGAVNTGIGFAISSNTVKRVVPSLIEKGSYAYPYLGLSSFSSMSLAMIQELDLPQSTGAYVANVVAGGPADKAGIKGGSQPTTVQGLAKGGDLIIAVDGVEVKDFSDLMSYLVLNTSVGDEIVLTVIRSGKTMDIPVTLGQRQ
ncbi:MAG: trypsin-like peptidase domain-containing protein [Anaerolineaceae bacterium]|jgi:2-alkenal reductase